MIFNLVAPDLAKFMKIVGPLDLADASRLSIDLAIPEVSMIDPNRLIVEELDYGCSTKDI